MPDFDSVIWDKTRIYTVDFGRAKTGAPHHNFPDVDRVGYHDEAFLNEHGPITSSVVGLTNVNVQFYRTEISLKAKLFAVSADPGILQIVQPASGLLTGGRSETIQFAPVKAGRTAIEIRYNWADGPVLGRLYVQIYDPLDVKLAIHLVNIDHTDSAGKVTKLQLPDRFLGSDCPDQNSKLQRAKDVFSGTNATWLPHGIVVKIPHADPDRPGPRRQEAVPTVWGAKELDDDPIPSNLRDEPIDANKKFAWTLGKAGARSPDRVSERVNVYCVPFDLGGIVAFTLSGIEMTALNKTYERFLGPYWVQRFSPAGIYVNPFYDPILSTPGDPDVAVCHSIAHELGHYMTLSGRGDPIHCSGDHAVGHGNPEAFRDDSVTRRRLLYPADALRSSDSMRWRKDTGYGDLVTGSFVTYRRLPEKQDITFEESKRARAAILDPSFYAF